MADDEGAALKKQEEDYTAEVDAALPVASSLAEAGKLAEAIDGLLPLEKKARIAADVTSTSRILVHIMDMCFERGAWDMLQEYLVVLIKRRGQLKKAVTDMVQRACQHLEAAPDKATTLSLIDTLRTITDGKIHVEIERARLTKKLADIKEADGDVAGAAEIMQELQVETFGSMGRRERVEFILEQMRLCLAKKDTIRAQIISKKISTRFFEDESTHDLKLKYYTQMLELAQRDAKYLDMCKHYRAMFDTPRVQESPNDWRAALHSAALYVILSSYSNEQHDLISRIIEEKRLQDLPQMKAVLIVFMTKEVTPWRVFEAQFGPYLRGSPEFSNSEFAEQQWTVLQTRLVEHNIRVMAAYYSRMRTTRMAELLELPEAEAEKHLANLVSAGTIHAKIDRPARIVVFRPKTNATDVLNNWATGLASLMSLVDRATHLIHKERMVHKV